MTDIERIAEAAARRVVRAALEAMPSSEDGYLERTMLRKAVDRAVATLPQAQEQPHTAREQHGHLFGHCEACKAALAAAEAKGRREALVEAYEHLVEWFSEKARP